MQKDTIPIDGCIREIDGVKRRYTDGYWIRYYDLHQKDNLNIALRLVGNFEGRFLKAAEYGKEVSTDEASILSRRKLFEAARKKTESITDTGSFEYKSAQAEENALGGMLAVSLFRKMINDISEHIVYRIEHKTLSPSDTQMLNKIKIDIDTDMKEVFHLFKYVRRAGGKKDKDEVLEEMRGEPMVVLRTTLSETSQESVKMLYDNRYRKIAACWKNIDDATIAIKSLISTSKTLKGLRLAEIVDDLSAAAKARCELLRNDPDFDAAVISLHSKRNLIRDFKISDDVKHAGNVSKKEDTEILKLVQSYRKLVYDIAHVRTPRNVSAAELIQKIEKLQAPGTSKAISA